MLPGNNGLYETNLFGEYDLQIIPTNEGRLKKLKKRLQVEKERYTQLLNYRPEGENEVESTDIGEFEFACFQQTVPRTFNKQELKLLKNEEMVKEVFESTYEKIKDMENELLPFDNKRRNIRPKFEIHLTKKQEKSEPCVIERINYTGDLHKAEESLREFMFAKRQHVVMAPFT
uniref:PPP1R35_C domain-containing protein n=1 Tax=Caenorhabditis tropicalis TaxID=1561998 RepID=A0A1I7TAL4_9PELO